MIQILPSLNMSKCQVLMNLQKATHGIYIGKPGKKLKFLGMI
jgi:hypothetical protein